RATGSKGSPASMWLRALPLLNGLSPAHRVADAPLAKRAAEEAEACELLLNSERQEGSQRLRAARTLLDYTDHPGARWEEAERHWAGLLLAEASDDLDTALTGDVEALDSGFRHLSAVLGEFPDGAGVADDAGEVLDGFLDRLPTDDACATERIAAWLGGREPGEKALERATGIVPEIEPGAKVGCGADLMADHQWAEALGRYEQVTDEYPDHELAAEARTGADDASAAIELDEVRDRLLVSTGSDIPDYCGTPAPYRKAAPYEGDGPHRALVFGDPDHKGELASSWLADGAGDAVLVICAEEPTMGATVETCPYESGLSAGGNQSVSFREKEIPIRVYEVRTGELVTERNLRVRGASCPETLEYEYLITDLGPPSEVYVTPSRDDVRNAYRSVIAP
ncbi:hypothetical protein, partial [Streptomyces sp. SM12]|uniref:hypothetical protein n=2 Tax=unclassified Streptomyces TaxID=2593676 RepID=UPI001CA4BF2E